MAGEKLSRSFYNRDVLTVAPELLGKVLVRKFDNGRVSRFIIEEVEAYRGEEDLACHASKGRSSRTEIMYHEGGKIYVYLIYGIYWMLNIVTGENTIPQAVLIRRIESFDGPGKLTRQLSVDKTFYGEDLVLSKRIWIENNSEAVRFFTEPRIGINYAGEYWKNKPWRFILKEHRFAN
ncbi:MAG: DNA-3-methyladenine glycosylase [Bacteroidales bacterium]|nr:DNA-3-methyladenine glycosylase [Bacteroidales bacterium]